MLARTLTSFVEPNTPLKEVTQQKAGEVVATFYRQRNLGRLLQRESKQALSICLYSKLTLVQ